MDIRLPEDFIKRMREELSDEAPAFFDSYSSKPLKALRLNTLKLGSYVPDCLKGLKRTPWEPSGFYYPDLLPFGKSPLHSAGAYYIQEPSAMAPVTYLDIEKDMCVLDLCAAPGGKSTQIASYLENTGLLISNEIIPQRAKILSQNIERLGIANALVINHDPKELSLMFPSSFDRILVDAPCSGEGMFRKDTVAVDEWSDDNVALCKRRGKEILDAAATMLKAGGIMVFSTCTFSRDENEDQIRDFLADHEDFEPVPMDTLEGERCGYLAGTIRIWPQDGFGEGHFIAKLKRKGVLKPGYPLQRERTASSLPRRSLKPYLDFMDEFIINPKVRDRLCDIDKLFLFKGKLHLAPHHGFPILSHMKVSRAGLELGVIKNDRFEPSHSLALALDPKDVSNSIDFAEDSDEVRSYLNGQTLRSSAFSDDKRGYCLVSVSSVSLGFGKLSNGMLKNHYPKGLRINY